MSVAAHPTLHVTANWKTTIGELCDKFDGDVQTGPFGSQLHASDYSPEGTPIAMPRDLTGGRIVCTQIARVGNEHVQRLSRHRLEVGDIVFSRRGDISRFAVVTEDEAGWLCGTGCIRIRLNCPDVDIGYLRRYLDQESIGKWLLHEAKGITMPNLNTKIVRALPFVYPPLAEQKRIAGILDVADALRAKRREVLAQLDTLLQATFLDMFGDPVANPMGWPRTTLPEISTKFTDGPFGSNLKSSHYVDEGIRAIRLQNIGVGELLDDDLAFISTQHYESLPRNHCEPGDVMIGTLGDPNLRACVIPPGLKHSLNKADCLLMRVDKSKATNLYACWLLNCASTVAKALELVRGQTRGRISMGRLKGLQVPLPPLDLQLRFSTIVESIEQQKTRMRAHLVELDALFASLQSRAFNGEL